MIFYFADQQQANDFYEIFNCYQLNAKTQELLYLIFLKRIYFFQEEDTNINEFIQELELSQLLAIPNCPLCLEKIDAQNTGLNFSKIQIQPNYQNKDRWGNLREQCQSCNVQNKFCLQCFEEKNITSTEDLWVCLICSNVGCGRYKAGHSLQHQKKTGHHFSKDLYSGRIWDYITDIFVHRLIQDNKDNSFLNLPEGQTLQDESQNSEKIQRIDNQIWEYCYVISQQMEEQRKFFESQIKEAEEEFKGEKEYKQLEEIQQEKEKKLNELRQNNNQIKQEILKNEKNVQILQQKQKNMKLEMEEIRMLYDGLQDNIKIYEKQEKDQKNELKLQKEDQVFEQQIKQEEEKVKYLQKKFEELARELEALD